MAKLDDVVRARRERAIEQGREPVPEAFQGVSKARIRATLRVWGEDSSDTVDAVFALLDPGPSWFAAVSGEKRFSAGASTAHVGCHVGILQRGETKLDREGRDYWLKPLRDLGAIEAVYLDPKTLEFVAGHPVPKSPNSAYRLNADFVEVLQVSPAAFDEVFDAWNSESARRSRAKLSALAEREARARVDTKHADLIAASISGTRRVSCRVSGSSTRTQQTAIGFRPRKRRRSTAPASRWASPTRGPTSCCGTQTLTNSGSSKL